MSTKSESLPRLKHLCPETHIEEQFAQLIASIPKSKEEHADQAKHIKKLVEAGWTVSRILDVGSGEGTFTKVVVDLLREAKACQSDISVDVIEKDKSLFDKCEQTLQESGVKVERLRVDQISSSPFQLPIDRVELLTFADRLKRDIIKKHGCTYDLIISSHATYYFENAGIDMAYALVSRVLKSSGYAWFVIRDRDCPFYIYREQLLANALLPDVHRDCFSDCFLDRMRCLIGDPGTAPVRTIETQPRPSSLKFNKDNGRPLAQYLLWLEGLSDDEVNRAAEAGSGHNGFSETHIWLSEIPKIKHEMDVLKGSHVIGRCVDLIRRVAPDINVNRASLTKIEPESAPEASNTNTAGEFDQPIIFPTFNLWSVGYGCETDGGCSGDTLESSYFKDNTSFLFYRRFYHDYAVTRHDASGSVTDHSVIEKLTGSPKEASLSAYRGRTIILADRFRSPTGKNPSFLESVKSWCSLLSQYYCSSETKDGGSMWMICVGCNILPDLRAGLSKDHKMNACGALFLTITSRRYDLKAFAPLFVGQIKARLAQWIAEDLHDTLSAELNASEKFRQMLAQLGAPLGRITSSLTEMQRETQELRAILYDPGKAIFESHGEIGRLFQDGIEFPVSKHVRILLEHQPDRYKADAATGRPNRIPDAVCILSYAMLTLFGRQGSLSECRSIEEVVASAKATLGEISRHTPFLDLVQDIVWLCSKGRCNLVNISQIQEWVTEAAASLISLFDDPVEALDQIKAAIHYPFKVDNSQNKGWPLLLAVKSYLRNLDGFMVGEKYGLNAADEIFQVKPEWTPVLHSAIVRFVTSLCIAQLEKTGGNPPLSKVKLESNRTKAIITIEFEVWPLSAPTHALIKENLGKVVCAPRDWRIREVAAGNFTGPFVEFASGLLGISDPTDSDRGWTRIEDPTKPYLLLGLVHKAAHRKFELFAAFGDEHAADHIILSWSPLS